MDDLRSSFRPFAAGNSSDGHHSVFNVGDQIEEQHLLKWMTFLVCIVTILDLVLHNLEVKCHKKDRHEKMLQKVYRELMILGMFSFILIMTKELGWISSVDSSDFLAFESAHMIIFFTALALTFQTICVYFTLKFGTELHTWLEDMSTSVFLTYLRSASFPRGLHRYCRVELMSLKIFRNHFMTLHRLPRGFNFASYLAHVSDEQVELFLEIEYPVWIAFLVLWGLIIATKMALENVWPVTTERAHFQLLFYFGTVILLSMVHGILVYVLHHLSREFLREAGCPNVSSLQRRLETIAWKEEEQALDERKDVQQTLASVHSRKSTLMDESLKRHTLTHRHHTKPTGKPEPSTLRRMFQRLRKREDPKERTSGTATSRRSIGQISFRVSKGHFHAKLLYQWFKTLLLFNAFQEAFYIVSVFHFVQLAPDPRVGYVIGLLYPLLLLCNSIVFQPWILHKLLILTSIFSPDTSIIGVQLDDMVSTLMAKEELGKRLCHYMRQNGDHVDTLEQAFDQDGDGFLDEDEFEDIMAKFGLHLTQERFECLLKCLSDPKTGKISSNELMSMVRQAHEIDQLSSVQIPDFVDTEPTVTDVVQKSSD